MEKQGREIHLADSMKTLLAFFVLLLAGCTPSNSPIQKTNTPPKFSSIIGKDSVTATQHWYLTWDNDQPYRVNVIISPQMTNGAWQWFEIARITNGNSNSPMWLIPGTNSSGFFRVGTVWY